MNVECVEAIAAGRVQCVGYREFARRVAQSRGLAGFVRNRADGTVEMRLVGAPDAIDAALAELRRGPPHGRVASLAVTARRPAAPESGFVVAPSV